MLKKEEVKAEVEVEFAKIKIYKERKEKDRFINSVNTLLISLLISVMRDKCETYSQKDMEVDQRKGIGGVIKKCDEAKLFEKIGGKYFNKGLLEVVAWLRNKHVKGRINTLETGEEDFELNDEEIDLIYYSFKNILKELCYGVDEPPKLCEFCFDEKATVKLGAKHCCELCRLKQVSFKEYIEELDSRNKKLIKELREKLKGGPKNPALPEIEKEKQQKAYDFLFNEILHWTGSNYEAGKVFANNYYEYLEKRIKEEGLKSDNAGIRVDFYDPKLRKHLSDGEIEKVKEQTKGLLSIKNEEIIISLLSEAEDYDKDFLDIVLPNFRHEYKDRNMAKSMLQTGGVLELMNALLYHANDGGDKGGMEGFIDSAEEQLCNLINPSFVSNEEELNEFMHRFIEMLQD